jgi:hypothetical protein
MIFWLIGAVFNAAIPTSCGRLCCRCPWQSDGIFEMILSTGFLPNLMASPGMAANDQKKLRN